MTDKNTNIVLTKENVTSNEPSKMFLKDVPGRFANRTISEIYELGKKDSEHLRKCFLEKRSTY